MNITISNIVDKPLYQQVKEQIKKAIYTEELREGDLLPSIRHFANELNISVLTVRRVYNELETEGFISSQIGIGTFVAIRNPDLLQDSRRKIVESKLQVAIDTANNLGISKSELYEILEILYIE